MKTNKPAYLALYESLREEITSGVRPFGSRLPSRRLLARDRGVSAVTAEHSLELLCEEGYAEPRPRSGCYVIYRESDGFTLPAAATERRLTPAAPAPDRDVFPFSALAKIMRRVLSEYGEEILVRPPNTGCAELQNALCSYLARNRGIRVSPDQIIIGAGAEYLYGLVVDLLGSSRVYGVEAPSYQKIEQVYRSRGVKVDFCPLGQDGILSGIDVPERLPEYVYDLSFNCSKKDPVRRMRSGADRIGQVIVKGEDAEQCHERIREILSRIKIRVT